MKTPKSLLIGTLILLWLAGCSPVRPDNPPQVVACPKPVVDKPLLQPAERAKMKALRDSLSTPLTSATATPTGSMPSLPN